MRLRGLREVLDEAYGSGAADSSTGLLVLVRNPEAPIDSEAAWDEFLVVGIHVDSDGGDLDLITDSSESESRMTLTELSIKLSELPAECDDLTVFVRGEHHEDSDGRGQFIDSPVVASALNVEQRTLAVIVEFDDYDEVLG